MRFLLRNWHLKLGAVALSTILYTGLVFSGSFSEDVVRGVPLRPVDQPNAPIRTISIGPAFPTIDVRYRIGRDQPAPGLDTFTATVDLSKYDLNRIGQAQSLPVQVSSLNAGVTVLGYTPADVSVTLDRFEAKRVPVLVDRGIVPEGLEIGAPQATPAEVQVSGPRTKISQVVRAIARVTIDASGIDVSQQVDLIPADVSGQRVSGVELTPAAAAVVINVRAVETSKTVPVRPVLKGNPASGYGVASVAITPAVVTLRGAPSALASVTEVSTEAIDVTNRQQNVSVTAKLVVPTGTRLASGGANAATVQVVVAVQPQAGSRTFLVGVVCRGAPAGMVCLPQVGQLALTLGGPETALAALKPADLTPIIDVSTLGPGQHTVAPTLSLPAGIQVVAISPPTVVVVVQSASPSPAPTP